MTTDQRRAQHLYVVEHKTAREIANKLKRTENTIGNWVKKYGWKTQRDARINSYNSQKERINEILNEYAEQTLYYIKLIKRLKEKLDKAVGQDKQTLAKELREQIAQHNAELARIDDGASKWRKQLTNLDKESRITLITYLQVMDDVFEKMRAFNQELYNQSIDFQEKHLQDISLILK